MSMHASGSIQPWATACPRLDYTTLGMFIVDQIHFGEGGGDVVDNVIGGAGTYGAIGARLFSPGPKALSIGWIVDAGNDFPPEIRQELEALGTTLRIRENPERKTTRGWNKYGPGGYREFKYLTSKRRLEVSDLTAEKLNTAKTIHLICSPSRAQAVCDEMYRLHEDKLEVDEMLIIWEPVPDLCTPENRVEMYRAIRLVHVISPNHDELAGFYGIDDPIAKNDPETIQNLAEEVVKVGIGAKGNGAVVVRAGSLGCLVARKEYPPVWLPAYYQPSEDGGNNPNVVDPTGGGNAFIGAMSVGLARAGKSKFLLAAAMGTIAASFAIEQLGIPKLAISHGSGAEKWNGVSTRERMDEYRKRLEDMGIPLDD